MNITKLILPSVPNGKPRSKRFDNIGYRVTFDGNITMILNTNDADLIEESKSVSYCDVDRISVRNGYPVYERVNETSASRQVDLTFAAI